MREVHAGDIEECAEDLVRQQLARVDLDLVLHPALMRMPSPGSAHQPTQIESDHPHVSVLRGEERLDLLDLVGLDELGVVWIILHALADDVGAGLQVDEDAVLRDLLLVLARRGAVVCASGEGAGQAGWFKERSTGGQGALLIQPSSAG